MCNSARHLSIKKVEMKFVSQNYETQLEKLLIDFKTKNNFIRGSNIF